MRSTGRTLNLECLYAEDKNIDYTYDKSENITKIKINGKKTYTYYKREYCYVVFLIQVIVDR